ncbi:hypothetical protein G9A89_010942 [Geosiphon pyriformis]|nr:hypothetical protein G9A89_010942 [Geosiphon pyriformis]
MENFASFQDDHNLKSIHLSSEQGQSLAPQQLQFLPNQILSQSLSLPNPTIFNEYNQNNSLSSSNISSFSSNWVSDFPYRYLKSISGNKKSSPDCFHTTNFNIDESIFMNAPKSMQNPPQTAYEVSSSAAGIFKPLTLTTSQSSISQISQLKFSKISEPVFPSSSSSGSSHEENSGKSFPIKNTIIDITRSPTVAHRPPFSYCGPPKSYFSRLPLYDRPFKCDTCPQSMYLILIDDKNHDLKRHKRIHLDIKPYACQYCEKQFSRKDAMKRHILVKKCNNKTIDGPVANFENPIRTPNSDGKLRNKRSDDSKNATEQRLVQSEQSQLQEQGINVQHQQQQPESLNEKRKQQQLSRPDVNKGQLHAEQNGNLQLSSHYTYVSSNFNNAIGGQRF